MWRELHNHQSSLLLYSSRAVTWKSVNNGCGYRTPRSIVSDVFDFQH